MGRWDLCELVGLPAFSPQTVCTGLKTLIPNPEPLPLLRPAYSACAENHGVPLTLRSGSASTGPEEARLGRVGSVETWAAMWSPPPHTALGPRASP